MSFNQLLPIYLKGVAMGAADVVPGVSGGTIAFVTGIYERLINALKNISVKNLVLLKTKGIAYTWNEIDGTFLLTLLFGIATSIFSLSHLITFLLNDYPEGTWSFFFGLILASTWILTKTIKRWNFLTFLCLFVGAFLAYGITVAVPVKGSDHPGFLFLSGSIAICAMILPGISGAFILLLLGMYSQVISSVKSLDIVRILIFGSGCAFGLISFSRVLSWMFKNFYNPTIALLTGFMIGSLNKVWPWKHTLESFEDHHGKLIPIIQENILPSSYEVIVGRDSYFLSSTVLLIFAITMVVTLEKWGAEKVH